MRISRAKARQTVRLFGNMGGLNRSVIAMIILGFGLGVAFEEFNGIATWHSYNSNTDKVNLCFTPPSGCGNLIAREISKAEYSIYLQAYGFTSKPIIRELLRAKERGVKVHILLDKSNIAENDKRMDELKGQGMDINIDRVSGIAHNKVIIIDKVKVITGSFNFTNAADTVNAENVIMVEDEKIASEYLQNWLSRRSKVNIK